MERQATWNSVGRDISESKSLSDVLKYADLDYEVVKRPIQTSDGIIIPGRVATVREDTQEFIGIVSPNYNICQNRDAFDFINYIDEDIKFVRAGTTGYGLIYIIAALPSVNILGDSFTPHAIFQNGHTGGVSIRSAICPLRIVCQNQFNMAFKEAENTIDIRHNGSMYNRIESARDVLKSTANYMKTVNKEAEKYAAIKVTGASAESIIDKLFPITDGSERTVAKVMEKRQRFINAINADDNQNFKGTAWGLINAYSDYMTHAEPIRKSNDWEDRRFSVVTFSPSMQWFMNILNESVSIK